MGEDHQAKFAALVLKSARRDRFALPPLDHRESGFRLRTLSVSRAPPFGFGRELHAHLPPPVSGWRLVARSAMRRGHQRTNAAAHASKDMVGFRIVARIRQERFDLDVQVGLRQQRHQAVDIRRRPLARKHSDGQMRTGVKDHLQLSVTLIKRALRRRFLGILSFGAAFHVVAAGMSAGEARRVHRGAAHGASIFHRPLESASEQRAEHLLREQSHRGFLQRGKVRDLLEAKDLAQVRVIAQLRDDAAIVGLVKLSERQTRKELWLGEGPRAELVGIGRQGRSSGGQRLPRHILWRLAGKAHGLL